MVRGVRADTAAAAPHAMPVPDHPRRTEPDRRRAVSPFPPRPDPGQVGRLPPDGRSATTSCPFFTQRVPSFSSLLSPECGLKSRSAVRACKSYSRSEACAGEPSRNKARSPSNHAGIPLAVIHAEPIGSSVFSQQRFCSVVVPLRDGAGVPPCAWGMQSVRMHG
jgi:hypothetical protein